MSNTTKVSPIETLAAATVKLEQLEEPRRKSRSDSFIHNLALARERLNSIAEAERKSRSNSFVVIQGNEGTLTHTLKKTQKSLCKVPNWETYQI